jgi:thiamine-phosphate pyrophosphorylase
MRGLYAIADTAALVRRGLDPVRFAAALCEARPAAVQLRAKDLGSRSFLELLRAVAPIAARHEVPLVANDRADLALLAGCAGVHVGQDDLPPREIRRFAGSLRVGMSAHDEAEVDRALAEAPDYIALGPVLGTASKENPSPTIGLDGLARLAARVRASSQAPLVAIGGIDRDHAAAVAALCPCAAVIAALLPPEGSADPYQAARARAAELHAALLEAAA